MIKLAFFDLDGTMSVPKYTDKGRAVIGFETSEAWIAYCEQERTAAYRFCKPVLPVKRYAKMKKESGAKLYVLTAVKSECEIEAKKAFVLEHYPDLFETILTVSGPEDKREIIKKTASDNGVPINECELVEDSFMTLLNLIKDGVKTTHLSEIVCEL